MATKKVTNITNKKSVSKEDTKPIHFIGNMSSKHESLADEFMTSDTTEWDVEAYFDRMLTELAALTNKVITQLRSHKDVTKELVECEDYMHTCTILANKHKYSHPDWKADLVAIDYKLTALAEINEMLKKNQWPTDNSGRAVRLSTYLETILWY